MQYGNHSLEGLLQQIPQEEQSLYRIWLNKVLREVMATQLTYRQQEVLHFYYQCGLNLNQIAKALGLDPSTVCRTKQRALKRIRLYLSILPKQ